MPSRVLISGSLGFIGRRLQPALNAHKHTVFGFDMAPPSGVDVRDFEWVRKVVNQLFPKPDIIVHLAANTSSQFSLKNPRDDFSINALGTINMLEIARENGSGFILPSSQKAVENDKGSRSPYGLSKFVCEALCKEWEATFGVKTIVNRFSGIYGPGGDKFWINSFIKKAINNEPVEVWGDGEASRDMLYVDDLIDLLVDEVDNFDKYAGHGLIQAGGGEDNQITINQLLKWLDYKNVTYTPSFSGDKEYLTTDNAKVTLINGWQPKVKLSDGLNLVKQSYEANRT